MSRSERTLSAAATEPVETPVPNHPDAPAAWAREAVVRPTTAELRISKRVLLHIDSQPRLAPGERVGVRSLTQEGMAEVLGATQGAVSNVLRRLVDGGALRAERRHVPGKGRRVTVYELTARGEQLARGLRIPSR